MTILTYAPRKLAERRMRTLDALTGDDRLMRTLGAAVVRKLTHYPTPYGPPAHHSPSQALISYYDAKRRAIRAAYFRQRYGRDYWTGEPRHHRAGRSYYGTNDDEQAEARAMGLTARA